MIKAKFTMGSIRRQIQQSIEKIEWSVIEVLKKQGEAFVADCRSQPSGNGNYDDRTGNLRSSIGYFIFNGNDLVEDNLDGSSEGKQAAIDAVNSIPKEKGMIYLFGVAGMNYAVYVESKGFNVISNQALKVISLLKGDLDKLSKML